MIAETFREACDVAERYGERLAAEGEICWGGMHSWKHMVELLEMVGRPKTLGFQADMAHTLLYTLGYNAPEDRILPKDYDWKDRKHARRGPQGGRAALRPWTIDFHVAQNDATVNGSGSHDKTGRHCLVDDPNGKLDIPRHAGYWLRDDKGELTKVCKHICWDGCMFPNSEMMKQKTWNDILGAMIAVRDAHGWCNKSTETSESGEQHGSPRKKLNIGMVGYGFMGRTHSNAFGKVNQFFDVGYEPVLKAVCGRDKEKVEGFAKTWGYESVETDWRKLVERSDIDLVDIAAPNNTHAEIAIAAAAAGKMVMCEKPLGRNAAEGAEMMEAVESANVPNMVWYNYRRVPAVTLAKAADRRGSARAHLSLSREIPAGLDHL